MGRNKQNRLIKAYPAVNGFKPYGPGCGCDGERQNRAVSLNLDEYEAIRLLDYEGKQQIEAAEVMNVSRPTLTRIYMEARKKIATAIVEGKSVEIVAENHDFESYKQGKNNIIMNQKIAIPTCEGKLWPHFGKAPQVTIVTVENGQVTSKEVLQAPEHEHGAMPKFIAAHGCTDVLCGGLGAGAVQLLNDLNIKVHGGAPELEIDELMKLYLGGAIIYGDSTCHHDGCGGHHHDHDDHSLVRK